MPPSIAPIGVVALAGWAMLAGCAAQPRPVPTALLRPEVEPVAEKPTILTLEYGNRSSRASVQIDLSGTDVQLDMSGSREGRDTAIRARPGATDPRHPWQAVPPPEDEGTLKARRIVDSTRIKSGDIPDSTLRKVVQHIRRSQEMFYAGRYPEAEDNARRANELKPTAEGLALAGSISWVRKDRENARRNWLAARELDPGFPGLAGVLDSAAPRQELSP